MVEEAKKSSPIVVWGGGFLALVVVGGYIASQLGFGPEPTITLAEYLALADGIPYSQAQSIIGAPGVESSRVAMPNSPELLTISYTWKNDDGSNAIVMFQGDKLTMKSQFGLK